MSEATAGRSGKRATSVPLLAVVAAVAIGISSVLAHDHNQAGGRQSGYLYLDAEIRALQDDDALNPGLDALALGKTLWETVEGAENHSCAECHKDAEERMWRIAAGYPKYEQPKYPEIGVIIGLEERINQMRVEKMKAAPFAYESEELLALTAYVAFQSRDLPVLVALTGDAEVFLDRGQELYEKRRGVLFLSCANCHEQRIGGNWGDDLVTEGQTNGFPTFRLRWDSLGSVQRQIRWCNELIGATPFAYGSDDMLDLQFYLRYRGRGLPVETPAVRP